MNPLAVDFPLSGDPWDYCVYFPSGTQFGNDLFDSCNVPAGYYLEVVSQPAGGIATFSDGGRSWGFAITTGAVPGPDAFAYRVTNGTTHSAPATVQVQLVDA